MSAIADGRPEMETRALAICQADLHAIRCRTDRLFANLMVFQWLAGIGAAWVISPQTWIGASSQIHLHVWAAIFLGGLIASLPVFLAWKYPGGVLTRHTIAVAQMSFSALLIHLTGGRIETHFHIFGSLAFLAIYRDWKVLLTATVVVAADHLVRGLLWPQSIFGIINPSSWRWIEHTGWVLFEGSFLVISTRRSVGEMYEDATRQAKLEITNLQVENQVRERTLQLSAAHSKLLASEGLSVSAFKYAAIGMALVSPTGRWLKVNRALCKLLGYRPSELYQKSFQDITHDLDLDLNQLNRTLGGEIQSYQMEKRYFHKSGHLVWVLLNVSLVWDEEGKPLHLISQLQDIASRKEVEARLETAHKELLELSRQAGMAEVATSVLHNVGNVLNSVNVSCSVIANRVRKTRIDSVTKTADLLRQHEDHLADFLTNDPTGKKLPAFVGNIAEQLALEQTEVLKEIQLLAKNIDHIKVIVATQQNYAKVKGITESIGLVDLMEDSLRMNESAIVSQRVEVIRDYRPIPPVTVEKHKALQILVNLTQNAIDACKDSGTKEPCITLQVTHKPGYACASVSDNGVGISKEYLTRIFAHGFTTKKEGHGFGLHSAALAAKEMGGALLVHSDGPGTGATFTLELPTEALAENKT